MPRGFPPPTSKKPRAGPLSPRMQLESTDDLWRDLDSALDAGARVAGRTDRVVAAGG